VAEGAAKAPYVEYEMKSRLQRSIRMVVLGHVQRGGAPSASDRVLATKLGVAATEKLFAGERGVMVGLVANKIKTSKLVKKGNPMSKVVMEYDKLLEILT